MKRILVDANVLVSLMTDRNAAQRKRAIALFESAAAGEHELLLAQAPVSDTVFVLRRLYGFAEEKIAEALHLLFGQPGTRAVHGLSWSGLFEIWPGKVASFDDALVVESARSEAAQAVATFDRRLARRLPSLGLEVVR